MAQTLKNDILKMFGQMLLVAAIFFTTGYVINSYLHYDSFIQLTFPNYRVPANTPTRRVFFLGNSYTFVNDLPGMVSVVAASDRKHPVNIEIGIFTIGGKTLTDLWQNPSARESLGSQTWDYVVLQDMSVATLDPEWALDMSTAMYNWDVKARAKGAQTVVYETWARKPGSDWYDPEKYPDVNFGDPETMQATVDRVTNKIAAGINAMVIPVGDAWAACRTRPDAPEIYNKDGTHPSVAGTYLTALLFYRALTGHHVADVTYVPFGMSSKDADILKRCAS